MKCERTGSNTLGRLTAVIAATVLSQILLPFGGNRISIADNTSAEFGAANAQPPAAVRGCIVSLTAPDSMRQGETAQVSVKIRNAESSKWRLGSGPIDFRLGSGSLDFRLGSGSLDFCCVWGFADSPEGTSQVTILGAKKLPRALDSGEEYTFVCPVSIPTRLRPGSEFYLRVFFQKDGAPEYGSGYKKILIKGM